MGFVQERLEEIYLMLKDIRKTIAFSLWSFLREFESDYFLKESASLVQRLKLCGKGVKINGRANFCFPNNIEIHSNVHIGGNSFINGRGGVTIEENTHISDNIVIVSSNHNYEGSLLPYDLEHVHKPVRIGKNVWIGKNVVIIPGCSIGDGAIIGAGTVVTKNVSELAIVGGASMRVIKFRDKSHYVKLDSQRKYGDGGRELR